jgi:hypothetical protein
MTLGHELCHLLCDRLVPARRFAILSPDERETGGRWRLYQEFEAIERRARAFGACLLAPAPAVVRLVGSNDPTSGQSVASVGKVFGLGRTAAINRLATVFRFGKSTRAALVGRAAQHWYAPDHPDRIQGGYRVARRCPLGRPRTARFEAPARQAHQAAAVERVVDRRGLVVVVPCLALYHK